jgi:hypothetical protein
MIRGTVSKTIVSARTTTVSGGEMSSCENNERVQAITSNTTGSRFCLKKYNFNTIFVQFL